MTSYVCVQLSTSEPHTCESWAVQEPLLPPLTPQDAMLISGAIFTACVVAYSYRTLFEFVKKFI